VEGTSVLRCAGIIASGEAARQALRRGRKADASAGWPVAAWQPDGGGVASSWRWRHCSAGLAVDTVVGGPVAAKDADEMNSYDPS